MVRKFIMAGFCAILAASLQAQVKKPAAKPAPSSAKKTPPPAGGSGINATNYSKVVSYLNRTIDCINAQSTAIKDRSKDMQWMYEFYVKENLTNGLGQKSTIYAPGRVGFNYADEKAGTECLDAKPPAFMEPADITFYTTNYAAIREAFITLTKHWNDVAAAVHKNGASNYSMEAGKKKAGEIETATDRYFEIRSALSKRTRAIQKSIFPYTVAKSPDKKQYINMNDDLTAIQEFASTYITSYQDIQANKTAITTALNAIEDAAIKHGMEPPAENGSNIGVSNYKSFYSYINDFIRHTKELINGTLRERDIEYAMDRNNYFYGSIIRSYNSIMSY